MRVEGREGGTRALRKRENIKYLTRKRIMIIVQYKKHEEDDKMTTSFNPINLGDEYACAHTGEGRKREGRRMIMMMMMMKTRYKERIWIIT